MILIIECPHCHEPMEIEQINCGIFRHGILKENFEQINPHLPKFMCDQLFAQGLIFGCGKPFQILQKNDGYIAIPCDYV